MSHAAEAKRHHRHHKVIEDDDDDSDVVPAPVSPPSPPPPPKIPELWFGVALEQDGAFVGGDDVCSIVGQVNDGFACFRASGSQYHGTPLKGVNDKVASGYLLATTRAKLTFDYVASDDITLGARVGYVLRGGGPPPDGGKKFVPWHLEVRGAYWFGRAFSPEGFTPYVFALGGMAQIDAHIGVDVVENTSVPPPPSQPDNPPAQHLDAYKKMGSGFGGAGVGGYLPFGKANGGLVELMLIQMFPSSGTAVCLSAGWAFGV